MTVHGQKPSYSVDMMNIALTHYMGVSKNNATPKSSILIGGFQYFHHPFWG